MLERIQKILSARGIASRRKAEEYIRAGLVTVNGNVASIGQKADPDADRIEVDGKVLEARREMLYYLMHKPVGVVTTNLDGGKGQRGDGSGQGKVRADERSPSVRDLLPPELRGKVFPVGRLDKDSEGLLLFTNDGVLAYRLTHPKFDHEKEYEVTTLQPLTEGQLRKMEGGMTILGEKIKPARLKRAGDSTFLIALTEGKNRQIRRMVQKVGGEVKNLRRVRILALEDSRLPRGKVRQLSKPEIDGLLRGVGLEESFPIQQ